MYYAVSLLFGIVILYVYFFVLNILFYEFVLRSLTKNVSIVNGLISTHDLLFFFLFFGFYCFWIEF